MSSPDEEGRDGKHWGFGAEVLWWPRQLTVSESWQMLRRAVLETSCADLLISMITPEGNVRSSDLALRRNQMIVDNDCSNQRCQSTSFSGVPAWAAITFH